MKPFTDNLAEKDIPQVLELYDWLKEKQLTARQAIKLLEMTEKAIYSARCAEADNLML